MTDYISGLQTLLNTSVALPEIFSAALSLLNLLEESLGRSKPELTSCKHNNTLCGDSTISKPYWTAFYRIKWALQYVSELGYLFLTSPVCI